MKQGFGLWLAEAAQRLPHNVLATALAVEPAKSPDVEPALRA